MTRPVTRWSSISSMACSSRSGSPSVAQNMVANPKPATSRSTSEAISAIERVAQVASDDPDGRRAALEQVPGQGVRSVAELGDRVLDAPSGPRRHDIGAPDDVGYGRRRDPGELRRRRSGSRGRLPRAISAPPRAGCRARPPTEPAIPSSGATSRSSCSMLRNGARRVRGQGGRERPPPAAVVDAMADRREVPRDVRRIARPAAVEQAVQRELVGVVADILGVGVADQRPEPLDDREGIHPLPEEVARIEVDRDRRGATALSRRKVSTLKTWAPGWSSRQIRRLGRWPCDERVDRPPSTGRTRFSHCQRRDAGVVRAARRSPAKWGAALRPGPRAPGSPTSRRSGRRRARPRAAIVRRRSRSCRRAIAAFGWSGLPETLNAATRKPRADEVGVPCPAAARRSARAASARAASSRRSRPRGRGPRGACSSSQSMSPSRDRWIIPSVTSASLTCPLAEPRVASLQGHATVAAFRPPGPAAPSRPSEAPDRHLDRWRRRPPPASSVDPDPGAGRRGRRRAHRPGHAPPLPARAVGPLRDLGRSATSRPRTRPRARSGTGSRGRAPTGASCCASRSTPSSS